MTDKVLSMLSLAAKAGKITSGEFSVEKAVKSNEALLVIIATDSSDRSKKDYTSMCDFYETDLIVYGTKETLGRAIGKEYRASVAVLDENFASSIRKKYEDLQAFE